MSWMKWSILLGCGLLPVTGYADKKSAVGNDDTAAIMGQVLKSVEYVLPMSLRGEEFQKVENQKKIGEHLKTLAAGAKALESHFAGRASDYKNLASSLVLDAREASLMYERHQFNQARFIVHNLTANCIACHTKLPARKDTPNPATMFANLSLTGISIFDRAEFKTMARQFDEAEKLYEQGFASRPGEIDSRNFRTYLKLALRVKQDVDSVIKVLEKVVKDGNLRKGQIQMATVWLESAQELKRSKVLQKVTLKSLKDLLGMAERDQSFQYGDERLVYYIAATSIGYRLLNNTKLKPRDRSELYYLVGQSEAYVSESFWVSEFETYLEESIRLAADAPWARDAYRLLEDEYVMGFTGSSGTHVPEDVKSKLKELREIINKAQGKSAS